MGDREELSFERNLRFLRRLTIQYFSRIEDVFHWATTWVILSGLWQTSWRAAHLRGWATQGRMIGHRPAGLRYLEGPKILEW